MQGPRKYKTRSNKKKQEKKYCTSNLSPERATRRVYTPAPEPNTTQSGSQTPESEDGERSIEDRSVDSGGADFDVGLTGETDGEARRQRATQASVSSPEREFV